MCVYVCVCACAHKHMLRSEDILLADSLLPPRRSQLSAFPAEPSGWAFRLLSDALYMYDLKSRTQKQKKTWHICLSETGSQYLAQSGLEFAILLPQPRKH